LVMVGLTATVIYILHEEDKNKEKKEFLSYFILYATLFVHLG
jgi:hypothetical protein